MSADAVRVLVVDDSAFARKVIREVLSRHPLIEVVGIARDGLEALEKINELKPDVITLDLMMPNLDGLGVLAAIAGASSPRAVIVSTLDDDSELALKALHLGAVDLAHKPTALATDRLYELGRDLIEKVLTAARANVQTIPPVRPRPRAGREPDAKRIVVVGASTGGPQALTRLLSALPADFPAAIAVVIHLPAGYTEAFAKRLDEASAIDVVEAHDGLALRPGLALVARGGLHLRFDWSGDACLARLDIHPAESLHRPSVDVLFESAARAFGSRTLAVVLTGMGKDGLEGARAVRAAGGVVLAESESSCVVYGMPRSVIEANLTAAEAPIGAMADEILRRVV